jgi:hypothetical protein
MRHDRTIVWSFFLAILMMTSAVVLLSTLDTAKAEELPVEDENLTEDQITVQIWTDKSDYQPEETVIIYGVNFTAFASITVEITRPDGHVDSSADVGSEVAYMITVLNGGMTDDLGAFTATYQLDGIWGAYSVKATDGTNVSYTWFSDAYSLHIYDTYPGYGIEHGMGGLFAFDWMLSHEQGTPVIELVEIGQIDPPSPTTTTNWNLVLDSTFGSYATLNPRTTFTPNSGDLTGMVERDTVQIRIDTTGLSAADYSGRLKVTDGAGVSLGYYAFKFTIRSPTTQGMDIFGTDGTTKYVAPESGENLGILDGNSVFNLKANLHNRAGFPYPWIWHLDTGYGDYAALSSRVTLLPSNHWAQKTPTPGSGGTSNTNFTSNTQIPGTMSVDLSGMTPGATYHGRLEIYNPAGDARDCGKDRGYYYFEFKVFDPATITAYKLDTEGKALSGWDIVLDGPGTADDHTLTTDSNGRVFFTVYHAGEYHISESVPASGWTRVSPVSNDFLVNVVSGGDYGCMREYTFVNFEWATVCGMKFLDKSGNGVSDDGDTGLCDWTIYLYKWNAATHKNELYATAVTDEDGCYCFTVKDPGWYQLRELLISGWTMTCPDPYDLEDVEGNQMIGYPEFRVTSGDEIAEMDFGNWEWMTISGKKFLDINGDGIKNGADSYLSGWTINLYRNDVSYATVDTDGTGSYSFLVKDPGTYSIREALTPGWTMTCPFLSIGDDVQVSDVVGYTDIVVQSGTNIINKDFGNFEWATVCGMKFLDKSGNGVFDDGDTGLCGWTIYLYRWNAVTHKNELYASAVTDVNGCYSFTVKQGGWYQLRELLTPGWTMTFPDPYVLEEVDGNQMIGYPEFRVTSGDEITEMDFGNWEWASICGVKFNDKDSDGILDWGNEEMNGWTILLYKWDPELNEGKGSWVFVTSQVTRTYEIGDDPGTDERTTGRYCFVIEEPGVYQIRECLKAGWTMIFPEHHVGDTVDTEAVAYEELVFTSGEAKRGWHIGNWQWMTICGRKFIDMNGDGDMDEGVDLWCNGWPIQLFNNGHQVGDTIYTRTYTAAETGESSDIPGRYCFLIKEPGIYEIKEYLPNGWTMTCPSLIVGSDSNFATGYTINVHSGENVYARHFGNWEWMTISGHKYISGTTTPLSGWHMQLFKGATKVGSDAVTDVNGLYSFLVKEPGSYDIKEVLQDKWTETCPVLTYSPGDGSTPSVLGYTGIPTVSGSNVIGMDFENFQWASICGVKFNDKDSDGMPDWGSENMNGWTILLFVWDPELNDGAGGWKYVTETETRTYEVGDDPGTEEQTVGRYCFTIKQPGTYRIVECLNASWTMTGTAIMDIVTPQLQIGDDDEVTQAVAFTGLTFTSGEAKRGYHIINWEWMTICGRKFVDMSGNGVFDDGDYYVNGWTIKLFKNGQEIDSQVTRTYTVPETIVGRYCFLIKEPGTYQIKEVLKAGWTMTFPALHVGDAINPTEWVGHTLTVYSGTDITGKHFGNWEWMEISGHKYISGTTTPISGWHMQLFKGVTQVGADAVTGVNGLYSFLVKEPGSYDIKEVLQDKWTETSPVLTYSPGDGTTPSVLGYSGIAVVSGTDVICKDFENFQWASICGIKFNDKDGDGNLDWGKEEMNGWIILLYRWNPELNDGQGDWVFVKSTLTRVYEVGEDPGTLERTEGRYCFTINEPGIYEVREVLKGGWTMIFPTLHVGDATDSEATAYSALFFTSGEEKRGWHIGNWQWASICGRKFVDTNGDGLLNDGENNVIEDWTFKLYRLEGGQWVYKQTTLTRTYLSGEDPGTEGTITGRYCFTIKEPGKYQVRELLSSGWTMTKPFLNVWEDANDNEVTGYTETPQSGQALRERHFANFEWLTVYGHKFFDANGNGDWDTGEPALDNWAISMSRDDSPYLGPVSTHDGGFYEFVLKKGGSYCVSEQVKPFWVQTCPDGDSYCFEAQSGADQIDMDFGNWLGGDLTGGGSVIVTDSGLCMFDVDGNPCNGRQFKLIYTPDVPVAPNFYRLTASNPGQFYLNVFYVGDLTIGQQIVVTLPYPFVTQGANPVHAYGSLNTGPCGCLVPVNDISGKFMVSPTAVTLPDLSYDAFGEFKTITLTATQPCTNGFVYVTIHLDYGLKKNIGGLSPDVSKNAHKIGPPAVTILENGVYAFSAVWTGGSIGSDTVHNMNVFKRDPGFGGLVVDKDGYPVKGAMVKVYLGSTCIGTVYTDEDGWYMLNFKHTGKSVSYTVKMEFSYKEEVYRMQSSVTVKANSFSLVSFQLAVAVPKS